MTPLRSKVAKQLISEDSQSGSANYKFTHAVELVPLCKDDLVVLPPRIASALGSMAPLVLVYRVSTNVFFVDPCTLQIAEMTSEKYWRDPFRQLMSSSRLVEFT